MNFLLSFIKDFPHKMISKCSDKLSPFNINTYIMLVTLSLMLIGKKDFLSKC